jgi:hypothetical protein
LQRSWSTSLELLESPSQSRILTLLRSTNCCPPATPATLPPTRSPSPAPTMCPNPPTQPTSGVKRKRQISSCRDGMRTTRLPDQRVPPPSPRPPAPSNQSKVHKSSRACPKLGYTASARCASSGNGGRRRRGPPPVALDAAPLSAPNLFSGGGRRGDGERLRCAGAVQDIFLAFSAFLGEWAGVGGTQQHASQGRREREREEKEATRRSSK